METENNEQLENAQPYLCIYLEENGEFSVEFSDHLNDDYKKIEVIIKSLINGEFINYLQVVSFKENLTDVMKTFLKHSSKSIMQGPVISPFETMKEYFNNEEKQ